MPLKCSMDLKDDSGVSVHTSKQDEAETSVIATSNPVVFQCSQCDAIVGDSTSWVSANKIMRTITLGRVTSKVGVKSEIEISQSSVDKGSEVLGKQYLASPPELDYIRGSFTIHVEKLNSYEVGSAQTSGISDLADMLNVPSPGYLIARVNKMQFLIVSMNDRIKNLEACLINQESSGKAGNMEHSDKKMQSCTLVETESVSSSDNFSMKHRTSLSGSDFTDMFDTGYRQNLCSDRQNMLVARPQNVESWTDFGQDFDQQTKVMNRSELAHKDRMIKRGVRLDVDGPRNTKRSQKNKNNDNMFDVEREYVAYADTDCDRAEKFRRQNGSGRKGRKEMLEMDQQIVGNERSWEQTNTASQAVKLDRLVMGSNNMNLKNRGIDKERVNNGFKSPKVRGSVSRNQACMETWPSPGIDRKGQDKKKRKILEMNDSE